jgi:stage V sporulation protein K
MRVQPRQPKRLEEISSWLRSRQITPSEAINLAVDLRRRQAAGKMEPAAADMDQEHQDRIAAVLAELDNLVGLGGVKHHVREIQAFTTIQMHRAQVGLSHQGTGLHMVFTGNPGTGKTTVARLLGRLFREMGLLPKGHMVEVERADLVGEYIGHTAQRTREVVRQAAGGVLFVDEAYSLGRGGEKDFGKESIDCIVRAMEEQRDSLMLILAGYPHEMSWFLRQNPGLRSRFPLVIHFPDYAPDELAAIGVSMWQARQYMLSADARLTLQRLLRTGAVATGGAEGNARALRNLVERSLRCQALRLVERGDRSRDDLSVITSADVSAAAMQLDGC